jgi:hypothetical protein
LSSLVDAFAFAQLWHEQEPLSLRLVVVVPVELLSALLLSLIFRHASSGLLLFPLFGVISVVLMSFVGLSVALYQEHTPAFQQEWFLEMQQYALAEGLRLLLRLLLALA